MIPRSILPELIQQLSNKYITVLLGPRQVGKTTLARALQAHISASGQKSLFFNLDIEKDQRYFASQELLLQKIRLEVGDTPVTVFIDELQRKADAGRFLKGIYDQQLPIKFVVTGSGSLDIKATVSESLAGRKRVFEIGPVTFPEFANYRSDSRYADQLPTWLDVEPATAGLLLQEYLSFGGYPDVVMATAETEKARTIAELYQAYIEKDVAGLLNIAAPQSFSLLLRMMADRAGKMVNFTSLANEANISIPTLRTYLQKAEDTFIIKRIPPYFNHVGKELTKAPQYYYNDLGLRNYALGQFSLLPATHPGMGFLFQNFIFQQLYRFTQQSGYVLHYWRTQDKAEVDFVINYIRGVLPVEVKHTPLRQPQLTPSFRSFIDKYQPPHAIVANTSLHTEVTVGVTRIHFLPWWHLLDDAVLRQGCAAIS